MSSLTPEAELLITDWFRRARESQFVHYECGSIYSRRHYFLGIPAIVLSTLVGTALFASVGSGASDSDAIAVGLISICAAVLASLQTFLGYSERAERHRVTGARYGAIRRFLEELKTFPPDDIMGLRDKVDHVRTEMDALASEAPVVPSSIKRRLDREIKARNHHRIFHLLGRGEVQS